MPYLTVLHEGGHRFDVNVEGHRLIVDDEVPAGGRDSGPAPTALLAARLASCAGAGARTFLVSHGYLATGLKVACHYRLSSEHPLRIAAMDVTVNVPVDLPDEERLALLNAVERCMVGNSLHMPADISVMVIGLNSGVRH